MDWIVTPAAGVLFSALSLVAAGLMCRRRSAPGGMLLFLLMLAVAEYTLATGLEAASVPLSWKTAWAKLQYLGSALVSTFLLLFAVKCPGLDCWLRGWRRLARGLVPAANLAAVSTNQFHDWARIGFLPGRSGANPLVYPHGHGPRSTPRSVRCSSTSASPAPSSSAPPRRDASADPREDPARGEPSRR